MTKKLSGKKTVQKKSAKKAPQKSVKKSAPKPSKKNAKKAPKKKAPKLSPEEQELQMIGDCLQEIFHIAGHAVEEGKVGVSPFLDIAMIAMQLHNETSREQGHRIAKMSFHCQCGDHEPAVELKEFEDSCAG